MMRLAALVVGGCTGTGLPLDSPVGSGPALPAMPSGRCDVGVLPCVDVATLPATWTVTSGNLGAVSIVGDINGDGHVDAQVTMDPDSDLRQYLVVLGPLDRPVVLPQDAAASGTDALPYEALPGDATGDGVPDFAWRDANGDWWLVTGPQAWPAAPTPLVRILGEIDDLNGDGLLDVQTDGNVQSIPEPEVMVSNTVQIWTSGYQSWSSAPDLTLRFDCQIGDGEGPGMGWVSPAHDTDGDGTSELFGAGGTLAFHPDYEGCDGWLIPSNLRGEIEVATSGQGASVTGVPVAVGDQDGDGTVDFLTSRTSVVSAPLQWTAGQASGGASTVLSFHSSISSVHFLGIDLDDDGFEDFGRVDYLDDDAQVATYWTGGQSGGVVDGTALHRLISENGSLTYLDGDVAYMLAHAPQSVTIVRLTP